MFKFKDGILEFVDPCLCNAWVATAVIGAGVLGAGATIYGAKTGADAQKDAAQKAIDLQQNQYQQTRSDLSPYRGLGQTAVDQLAPRLSDLTTGAPVPTAPAPLTQAELEATPGWQWQQTQGLKAAQNSAAARGLGTSGAALKGAATFASGLADSTYNTRFNQRQAEFGNQQTIYSDVMQNKSTAFDRLSKLIDTGENAGAQTGVLGEKAAYNSGVATVGAGNAEAAADNATGKALSGLASNVSGYAMAKGIYGNSAGPITYGGPNGPTPFA